MNCGDVIRKTAWTWPDSVAIQCGGASLTFAQVYERCCRQVNALNALGLQAPDRVALLGANGLWSMEEMLGLALGGFTRLSLHGRNTVAQHRDMLERIGARALIVDEASYPVVAGLIDEVDSLEHIIVHGTAGGTS
jgi:acyl-CoA synthetase (AMP-forming)/AMP-acid ligase II